MKNVVPISPHMENINLIGSNKDPEKDHKKNLMIAGIVTILGVVLIFLSVYLLDRSMEKRSVISLNLQKQIRELQASQMGDQKQIAYMQLKQRIAKTLKSQKRWTSVWDELSLNLPKEVSIKNFKLQPLVTGNEQTPGSEKMIIQVIGSNYTAIPQYLSGLEKSKFFSHIDFKQILKTDPEKNTYEAQIELQLARESRD